MMKRMKHSWFLTVVLTLGLGMSSCEVEFSPNAEWKEIPVVYCVLDQDDSLSWVRVERCYLSEGDVREDGMVTDSVNYPQGSIQVSIIAFDNGRQVDSIPFDYTTVDHAEGAFVSQGQPAYCAVTKKRLRDAYTYELRVRRADGSMLAKATTSLVTKDPYQQFIIRPSSSIPFGFSVSRNCKIEWYSMGNGRYYQPMVRFYYTYKYLGGDTLSLDFLCSPKLCTPPYANTYYIQYSCEAFLAGLHTAFDGDTNTKTYPMLFDIYLNACNEDLYAYLSSVEANGGLGQSDAVYTNIEGGLGVFAARRTHVYRRVPGDASDVPGYGLHALLRDSIPGFI